MSQTPCQPRALGLNDKKMIDHWYCKDFVQSQAALLARCRAEIVRLIAEAGPAITTACPFQVFDWILCLSATTGTTTA